ncbi:MAG: hypothetical protein K5776_08350 [Lachnospiraceae bacterium]|nr:hypothetical protein [Lachnospiraceae bacterium]
MSCLTGCWIVISPSIVFILGNEAVEWEAQFKLQQASDIDMTLEAFYELYEKDVRPRLKENTWMTKQVIRVVGYAQA